MHAFVIFDVCVCLHSGHNVYHRHRHQLPDHVREQERRGGVGAQQDSVTLFPRMVPHRPGGRHTVRPSDRRVFRRNGRGTFDPSSRDQTHTQSYYLLHTPVCRRMPLDPRVCRR